MAQFLRPILFLARYEFWGRSTHTLKRGIQESRANEGYFKLVGHRSK